ncbi:NADH-quinone oxidoreductase subunit C, partial [bacterium]|nr:NADH-quinone oxidoreductase subunit C [bacterium]
YLEPTPRIGIVIHLHSMETNTRLRIKCFATSIETPTLPSLTGVFSAANWMERETYDFFGIQFSGHPNLIRILNDDSMTIFPMRKEYPLEDDTREDKDDTMFGR